MHECERLPEAFFSLAGEINTDLLGKVFWEHLQGAPLGVPEIEQSHVLSVDASWFNHRCPYFLAGLFGCIPILSSLRGSRAAFTVTKIGLVWRGHARKGRCGPMGRDGRHGAVLTGD